MKSTARPGRTRPQLSDEASAYVRGMIMAGQLRPGDPVRAEVIAGVLKISTTPAREGLQALRVEGFLDLVARKGFVVAPLTGQDIEDLFHVQALLAGELTARAALSVSEEDLAELDALHHEIVAASRRRNYLLLEEKNHAFHREINLIADSRKIIWVLGLMSRYVPRKFYAEIEGWPSATYEDHSAVLNCLRNRDPEGARTAMCQHVIHSGELLARQFTERAAG